MAPEPVPTARSGPARSVAARLSPAARVDPSWWYRASYDTPLLLAGLADLHGVVLDANDVSVRGAGYALSDVLGRPFWEGPWWGSDAAVRSRIRELCRAAVSAPVRAESVWWSADGAERHVDLALHAVLDDAGDPAYLFLSGLDSTERVHAQDAAAAAAALAAQFTEGEFAELVRALGRHTDPGATLVEVVAAAVALVPGCAQASITAFGPDGSLSSEAPSGDLARMADRLQLQVAAGPCLDAARTDDVVRVPDLTQEVRWPAFTAGAVAAGVASMLSLPLDPGGGADRIGSLNLYGTETGALDAESEYIGVLLAGHAAVAIATAARLDHQVQLSPQLQAGLWTRSTIDQAVGVVIAQRRCSPDDAFSHLRAEAASRGLPLRIVAAQVVERTGREP